MFRGKFLSLLAAAFRNRQLRFSGRPTYLAAAPAFDRFLRQFRSKTILADHLVGDGAGTDGQIASSPQVPAPELFSQKPMFLQQHTRADPLSHWMI